MGLLYRADSYEGVLKSSEEGQVYWISREEYEKKDLVVGMRRVLQIMDDDTLTECFMDVGRTAASRSICLEQEDRTI